jgi:hypothetical protein
VEREKHGENGVCAMILESLVRKGKINVIYRRDN